MSNFPKLENGMVVVTRDGTVLLVFKEKLLVEDGWLDVNGYSGWKYTGYASQGRGVSTWGASPCDIVKVFTGANLYSTDLKHYTESCPDEVLWDKNEQVTILKNKIAELQEELKQLGV